MKNEDATWENAIGIFCIILLIFIALPLAIIFSHSGPTTINLVIILFFFPFQMFIIYIILFQYSKEKNSYPTDNETALRKMRIFFEKHELSYTVIKKEQTIWNSLMRIPFIRYIIIILNQPTEISLYIMESKDWHKSSSDFKRILWTTIWVGPVSNESRSIITFIEQQLDKTLGYIESDDT